LNPSVPPYSAPAPTALLLLPPPPPPLLLLCTAATDAGRLVL
jgi:hypothetical protein